MSDTKNRSVPFLYNTFSFKELKYILYIGTEQNRIFILFKHIYSLSQLQSYKMHGLLNIHIQFYNYSLDGINFTIVLEL